MVTNSCVKPIESMTMWTLYVERTVVVFCKCLREEVYVSITCFIFKAKTYGQVLAHPASSLSDVGKMSYENNHVGLKGQLQEKPQQTVVREHGAQFECFENLQCRMFE